jgi:hypothetical protein
MVKRNQIKQELELPGDIISDRLDVPLISILNTSSYFIIIFIIVADITIATITVIWLLRKIKTYQ